MARTQSYFRPAFKAASKVVARFTPKVHLYRVTLVTGEVFTTPVPTTKRGAYEAALVAAKYGKMVPVKGFPSRSMFVAFGTPPMVRSSIIADPIIASPISNDPKVVQVWFVEKLMREKAAAAAKAEVEAAAELAAIVEAEMLADVAAEAQARADFDEMMRAAKAKVIPPRSHLIPVNVFTPTDDLLRQSTPTDHLLDEHAEWEALMGANVVFDWSDDTVGAIHMMEV